MQKYRPDIDGLRALAVLPVILYHAGLGCSGGFVGVDIFFVISGFLITSLILREIDDDEFSLATFWERRIRRILPALMVVILASLVAAWFLYLPGDFLAFGKSILSQAVLISNVFFYQRIGYFEPGTETLPLLHTWSLAVEEQFYLFFPLLLIFLARLKQLSISRTIVCLAIGSFALSVVGSYLRPSATFYLLPARAWELMVGAFLAATPPRQSCKQWLNEVVGLTGLGLILYPVFFYTDQTRFPGLAAIPPCLGAALIIISSHIKPTLVGKVLVFRPVVFLGLISYSLYLWHWPVLAFSKYISFEQQSWELRATLLMASVVLAILSWKFIETPFRKRWICPRRPQVFALASCSMLGLLIFGGGIYVTDGMTFRLPAKARNYADYRNDRAFLNYIPLKMALVGQFAEVGGQDTNRPIEILIWGDSHAMAVTPVLDELCRRFSVRGVEATYPCTPPLLDYLDYHAWNYNNSLKEETPAFSKCIVDFVSKRHVKTVILAADWTSYGTADSLNASLVSTVQALMDAGAKVYVLKDAPKPHFDVPRRAAMTIFHHGNLDKLAVPLEIYQADKDLEPIFDHIFKMGAIVLDTPRYFLNTNGFYDVIRDDKVLYYDGLHLSVEGSKVLEPMFQPLFRQIKQERLASPL